MISYEDCVLLSQLTEDEIDAIAEHEGIPEFPALELGEYLLSQPDGVRIIAGMIRDDIGKARAAGDAPRVTRLKRALRHLLAHHPDRPGAAPG